MSLNFGESKQRRIIGGVIGLIFSFPVFINSGSLFEFVGFTIAGVLSAVLTTEICHRIWERIGRDNIYLKIFASITGLVVVILTLYLTVFFSWAFLAGNATSCLMDMEKPVENKFTGQCRMVEVCGTTPWYYKQGCSSGNIEASSSCLSAIQAMCAADGDGEIEKPTVCEGRELPDRYSVQNGKVTCPS